MQNRTIIIYCGLLLTMTAFSTDILLPAYGMIADDLHAKYAHVQLLIPIFMIAVGIGHLFGGSLADRFGRRTIIIVGLSIYIAGILVSMIANNIEVLHIGRVLQGIGASAGPVVARAIIRDLYSGRELARNMAFAMAVFAFGPIVAPLAGAGMLLFFDWRMLFVLMLIFAGALLLVCIFWLPETIKTRNPAATKLSTMLRSIGEIFAHQQSRFYLLLSGIMMAMILIILTSIAGIYQDNFGVSGIRFAIIFSAQGLGIIIGQVINRRLIDKVGIEKSSYIGSGALVVVSIAILVISLGGWMGPYLLATLLAMHASSYLVVYSNAATMTLDPHGKIAGFTSSFYGFFSQVISSVIGAVLSLFIDSDLIVWSAFLLLFALITFAALMWRDQRSVVEPVN